MDRRTYLSLTATATVAGIAGCQGGDDTTDDTTDGPSESGTIPAWRKWVPSELVVGVDSAQVVMLDTNRAKSELPDETYSQFQIGQIAGAIGVSESNIDRMAGVQSGENDSDIVLTGSYNPSQIVDNLDVSQSDIETYNSYQVLQEQIAIGSSAIVVSSNYELLIDTEAGNGTYLGQNDEDWDQLLTSIQDGTLAVATPGTVGDETTIQADKSGVTINAADGGGANIGIYVHFESDSAAKDAMDTARDEFASSAAGGSNVDIERFDRQGSRLIIEGTTPNFSFSS